MVADKVASAWFAGWHASSGFAVSNITWSKYTQMTFAFATTTPDVHQLSLDATSRTVLPQLVAAGHAHGVAVTCSIGGWTGSQFFSTAVGSAANRTAFVRTVINLVTHYNLDGVDFDWEYPGLQGIGCNTINPNDTTNFLSFLQELRRDPIGSQMIITAAASDKPFIGSNGLPIYDATGFAEVLDYVAFMNYDVFGPWTATAGPNAPLNDACANSKNRVASAVSAVRAWTDAGFTPDKLVLGVPGYGHGFRVKKSDAFTPGSKTNLALFPPQNANNIPVGDTWDGAPDSAPGVCGVASTQASGVFNYWGLMQQGYLDTKGKPKPGIIRKFDSCSQTPFLYNPDKEVYISYDDAKSFAAKGHFIANMGLRGFSMWEAGGDYHDTLTTSIRNAAEFWH
ncbi:endochitinase [Pluteus cervinus]|uniref:Endochitinase n=1 Tax=Pluteus cervinus TaxID=181527 RepID=A0ACD3AES7_9AGAR|nr:endochitinase [Pluteus cervinus]